MIAALTVLYLACFQCAALPTVIRVCRRKSSADLSVWREWLILAGVIGQLAVMLLTHAHPAVWISPILSGLGVSAVIVAIQRHR